MRIPILILLALVFVNSPNLHAQETQDSSFLQNKIRGMLLGTLIGDALGGPIEFWDDSSIQATPNPPKLWKEGEIITNEELKKAAARIYFREYKYLRPMPEPYGHWTKLAAPGTVTDDSRHKCILFYFLRNSIRKREFPVNNAHYAQAYLDWSASPAIFTHPGYDTLVKQWLDESYKAINWILGIRDPGKAYPPERLWNGLPTCYGQMALTPLAGVYPGDPHKAYLSSYQLAWFENGFAKDMTGAINAGLAHALTLNPSKMTHEQLWMGVEQVMRTTDPYAYNQVPWSERAVNRWLNKADQLVLESNGSPAKLFRLLNKEFEQTIKWEAQVPFVVIFSCLKICKYDPLAALQLSIEWGWDHDSYAQLLGAFVGAIYGTNLFKEEWKYLVNRQLWIDYSENIDEWTQVLWQMRILSKSNNLFN